MSEERLMMTEEEGLSNVAYFRTDGGSSKLYTQEYVDKQGKEIERLNNIIEKLEQENAVLKTQVVNKDKYSYGIRMGSDEL